MINHTSVLLHEWLEILQDRDLHIYVDGTLGAGGHAEAVLERHGEIEKMVGIDQDIDAIGIARDRLSDWLEKIELVHGNFGDLHLLLTAQGIASPVDAIFLDIGVSSMQLDRAERGFSFMRSGPLDMRMNRCQGVTAEEIVNTWPEEEIGKIFREYGEEKRWKAAAKSIAQSRRSVPFRSTKDLVDVLTPVLRNYRKREIHPLTQVFQALRIAVNGELDVLRQVIPQAVDRLSKGGVLGIITFHSLEDRIVKQVFQSLASDKVDTAGLGSGLFLDKTPEVRLINRKPIIASKDEIRDNPRSRSAKLRVVEKI